MRNKLKVITLYLLSIILITGCASGDIHKARAAWNNDQDNDILIGVAGRLSFLKEDTNFMKGVYMAVDEVNYNNGILGRHLAILEENDNGSLVEGTIIAQELSQNPGVMAVIGHTVTDITLSTSTIYENAGMLLMSPIVSNPKVTKKSYNYIIQNISSDDDIGEKMALYAASQGYKNIVVYYADNLYGKGLSTAFEDVARDNGIKIIDRVTFFSDENSFQRALKKWEALDMDAVFIADSLRTGKEFIVKLKNNNVDVPVLGGDGLDTNFIEELGEASEGAVIATLSNLENQTPRLKKLIESFKDKYGHEPDGWAIQGYESIKLLTYALENTEELSPEALAKVLKSIKSWEGISDKIHFDADGSVIGKTIYLKMVQDGRFHYLNKWE